MVKIWDYVDRFEQLVNNIGMFAPLPSSLNFFVSLKNLYWKAKTAVAALKTAMTVLNS